jgi:hypothetical protein
MALQKNYTSKFSIIGDYWFITDVQFKFQSGMPQMAIIHISCFTGLDDMLSGSDPLETFVFSIPQAEFMALLSIDKPTLCTIMGIDNATFDNIFANIPGQGLFAGTAALCYYYAKQANIGGGPGEKFFADAIWVD